MVAIPWSINMAMPAFAATHAPTAVLLTSAATSVVK